MRSGRSGSSRHPADRCNGCVQRVGPRAISCPHVVVQELLVERPIAQVPTLPCPVVKNAVFYRLCHGPPISPGFVASEAAHGRL